MLRCGAADGAFPGKLDCSRGFPSWCARVEPSCGRSETTRTGERPMNAAASTTTKTPGTKKTAKAVKTAKPAGESITLAELAERFLKHLEQAGKSRGTTFSYQMDLEIAKAALGAQMSISAVTAEQVQKYFESDAVTKTRKGRAKAKPTIDKTRRVLRLALAWAAEKKLIEKAPVPEIGQPAKTA